MNMEMIKIISRLSYRSIEITAKENLVHWRYTMISKNYDSEPNNGLNRYVQFRQHH
jgi:hypothetical protein